MKTSLFEKAITYNFEKLFKDKGYVWFDKGNYNLNIIYLVFLTSFVLSMSKCKSN